MLSVYIVLYQYFDHQESLLLYQIEQLQEKVIYQQERKITAEESQQLTYLKIKLDFCRKIESEVLQILNRL